MISMRDDVVPRGEKYYFVIVSGHLKDGRGSRHYLYIMCSRLCCGLFMKFYVCFLRKYIFFCILICAYNFGLLRSYIPWFYGPFLRIEMAQHGSCYCKVQWHWKSLTCALIYHATSAQNISRYHLKTAMSNRRL